MKGIDFVSGARFEETLPRDFKEAAVICRPGDLPDMAGFFKWDESTVRECTNLDENVRHTSYDGYDFTSLVYMEIVDNAALHQEINIFIAKNYLVLVIPERPGPRLLKLLEGIEASLDASRGRPSPLIYFYYSIFNHIASDFSEMLEALEDDIEALSESIDARPERAQGARIGNLRRTSYAYKKLLRAASYIGDQIAVDENKLLKGEHTKYFKGIGSRLVKLYDFADSLFQLSGELIHSYESKLSAQTNEMVNKLTVITLFFGPMTVIAGIYGMNFTNMPELKWAFGYPAALGLMAAVSFIIFLVLKKKKWL